MYSACRSADAYGTQKRKPTHRGTPATSRGTWYGTLATPATSAAAECKQPGNLSEAVKRGWENLHFCTETGVSEPEQV